jgi:uncharacterized GH25 family protein
MNADDFESYLVEEGLDAIAEIRKERGESAGPAVERYTKFAKAVVEVGDGSSAAPTFRDAVGHALEILPLDDPTRIRAGEPLRLRVLFHSEPLAGVHVKGGRATPADENPIAVTTDEQGECAVTATAPGRWYVRALHMVSLEEDPEVRWESYWATLTFEAQPASGGEK